MADASVVPGSFTRGTPAEGVSVRSRAYVWLVPVVLLAAHFALLASSASVKSATADEPLHLLAGYSSLALRDFGFSQQHHHPALGAMLNAVPLLFVRDLHVPATPRQGGERQPWRTQFLYQQHVPGDQLLIWCRLPTMVLSLLLAILVYRFAKVLYGTAAACVALMLQVLSPNILAHGQLITTDMIATVLIIAACWALWHYLASRRVAWLIAASVIAGLAL